MPSAASHPPIPRSSGSVASPHKWTREEYDRLVEAGGFHPDARVELLEGEIVDKMSPQNAPHATVVLLTELALRGAFAEGCHVRTQLPIAFEDSEPEPDVVVVNGVPRDYLQAHPGPADIQLLVEVSDASLSFDRTRKLAAYARAGVSEYWILNILEAVLEVYREPEGEAYRSKATLGLDQAISPVARPDASIAIEDLLP